MATTKITNPELFDLGSLNTALKLPSGTTAERPTSPSTGEWRYNTTTNLVEFWDGGAWRDLQSENIPPINSENFNTVVYTGNGSTQSITGVGFKPDFVWIKSRSLAGANHVVYDTTRGAGEYLIPNTTGAEGTIANGLTSFDSDGFTLGSEAGHNFNGATFVAWCWKAEGGTTSTNTEGSDNSTVQVNTKAGFSIVQYTATTGTSSSTTGHGLGTTPAMIILKRTDASESWYVWHKDLGAGSSALNQFLKLDSTSPQATATSLFGTVNSTVFATAYTSGVPNTNIAYCFAEKAEYSKFGSYIGNGTNNGPVVNTGFEPAYIMIKNSTATYEWTVYDNKRSTSNPRDNVLYPNTNGTENSGETGDINFLTNGFQPIAPNGTINHNGGTMIYAAFAADPSSTAPALPDSFANKLYTGNGGTQSITGLGFSPSMVWLKSKSFADNHNMADTVRGPLKYVFPNSSDLEFTSSNYLSSFDSDGFTLGSDGSINASGQTFVAWNWKANPMPTVNTDGTIQSVVSANQAAGFSIVKWTGDGNASSTVGHGLSGTPDFIMLKDLTDAGNWNGAQVGLASNEGIGLNSSAGAFTGMGGNGGITYANLSATNFGFATGSSGVDSVNKNGNGYVAYCWKSVAGFSKMESYIGNGGSQSITTGFSPDWLMFKRTDQNGWNWEIADTARGVDVDLAANSSGAEQNQSPANRIQIDANGFTHLTGNYHNISGAKYIYMAYKENLSPPTPIVIPAGQMSYMVVAGGASGASNGGGGGAGGLRTSYGSLSGGGASSESNITLSNGTYTITIGAGGALVNNSTSYQDPGNDGTATTISGNATVNTVGGGGGGSNNFNLGRNGGCGGGAGAHPGAAYNGGSGTAGEGFDGGRAGAVNQPYAGAGGGGTGAVGEPNSASAAGAGGDGLQMTITGARVNYGGGGGGTGGTATGSLPGGAGGAGGGGTGGAYNGNGVSGTANTGGGGGGSGDGGSLTSGAGGSGVVILRMNTSDYSGTTTGSPTVTTDNSYTILTYTGSGTYVHS